MREQKITGRPHSLGPEASGELKLLDWLVEARVDEDGFLTVLASNSSDDSEVRAVNYDAGEDGKCSERFTTLNIERDYFKAYPVDCPRNNPEGGES